MIGKTFSHFKILDRLGKGGMGEVYLAEDSKLRRKVAVKVLPGDLAADPERLERFKREARSVAALNHPRIVTIHSVEELEGVHLLTMEHVEGKSLDKLLPTTGFGLETFFELSTQIADGLAAAHEKDIIHRDLKPANVMLTDVGRIKILDFGLAKLAEREEGGDAETELLTQEGSLLGTPHYMSPEQVENTSIDHRSDIFSLGILLYEMATGQRPFEGESSASVISSVLRDVPPRVTELKADLPNHLGRIVRRCLEKDPGHRYPSAREVQVELERLEGELATTPEHPRTAHEEETSVAPTLPPLWRRLLPWAAAAMLGVAVLGLAFRPEPERPLRKFELQVGPEARSAKISPDGGRLAFWRSGALWVRELDGLVDRRLDATEGVSFRFFWSYDGREICYGLDKALWRLNLASGSASFLADLQDWRFFDGGSWSELGTIVYSDRGDLFSIDAAGGEPELLLESSGDPVMFPEWLPEERGILFGRLIGRKLQVLAEGEVQTLKTFANATVGHPVYSPTGHVLFRQFRSSAGLYAIPFSLSSLQLTGEPALVAAEAGPASLARDGSMVYLPALATQEEFVWVSRDAEIEAVPGEPWDSARDPAISPDGTKAALSSLGLDGRDIWLHDLVRGAKTRVTSPEFNDGSLDFSPQWSADGDRVVFHASFEIYSIAPDGSDPLRLASGWSPSLSKDGRFLAFEARPATAEPHSDEWDIHYLELDGADEPVPLIESQATERDPRISPDGQLLLYRSDDSGQFEIYLRRFPSGSGRQAVSTNGGNGARWGPDGDEIFYWEGPNLMSVSVMPGNEPGVGPARRLFSRQEVGGSVVGYDVAPDGERFLILRRRSAVDPETGLAPAPVVVQNWFAELEGRE